MASERTVRHLRLALAAALCAMACAGGRAVARGGAEGALAVPAADAVARAYVDSLRTARDLPSLVVAVARPGPAGTRVVWSYASGLSDVERRVAADDTTLYRVGSLSKLLTATAAAALAERGRLDLDAPVARYLPDLPPALGAVTARQLAGHLAGVRHYGASDYVNVEHYDGVRDALRRFVRDTLVAVPGTRYFYSSYGYNLLGAVVEAVAGRPYADAVRDAVLAPLMLRHTRPEPGAPTDARRARLYVRGDSGRGLRDAPPNDPSDRVPSGGFLSTASDLARFGAASLARGFLTDATRATLLAPQRAASGPTGVGLGWRVATDTAGRRTASHGGDALGGRAFLLVRLGDGVAVALTSNVSFAPLGEGEARRVLALVAP